MKELQDDEAEMLYSPQSYSPRERQKETDTHRHIQKLPSLIFHHLHYNTHTARYGIKWYEIIGGIDSVIVGQIS